MQTLSKVPFNDLRVGDRVKSKVSNIEGVINCIYKDEELSVSPDNQILIKWEISGFSICLPDECNMIWLM